MPPSRISPEARAEVLEFVRAADQQKGVTVLNVFLGTSLGETLVRRCLALLKDEGLADSEYQGPNSPHIWRAAVQSDHELTE